MRGGHSLLTGKSRVISHVLETLKSYNLDYSQQQNTVCSPKREAWTLHVHSVVYLLGPSCINPQIGIVSIITI